MRTILCKLDNPLEFIRMCTTISYLFVPIYLLMLGLDVKILYIYFKFGDRLSAKAAIVVKNSLVGL